MEPFWDRECSKFTKKLCKPPLNRKFSYPDWSTRNPYLTLQYYDNKKPKSNIKLKSVKLPNKTLQKRIFFNANFGKEIGRLKALIAKNKITNKCLNEYVDKIDDGLTKIRKVKEGKIVNAFKFSNKTFDKFKIKSQSLTNASAYVTKTIDAHIKVFESIHLKMKRLDDVMRCYQTKILPDKKQRKILDEWFKISVKIYNSLVDKFDVVYNKCHTKCTELYENAPDFTYKLAVLIESKFPTSGSKLREKYNILYSKKYNIPNCVSADIIMGFAANVKGNVTKLKRKQIKFFHMEKRKIDDNFSISIQRANTRATGFYPKTFGKMKLGEPKNKKKENEITNWNQIQHDYKLLYDKFQKSYYLNIPVCKKPKEIPNRKPLAVMDPGMVIFQELYGLDHTVTIGKDLYDPIMKSHNIIKEMNKRIKDKTYNRKMKGKRIEREKILPLVGNKNIAPTTKKKRGTKRSKEKEKKETKEKKKSKKKALRKVIKRENKKIQGLVTELHNKTCLYLCRNYDRIVTTEFSCKKVNGRDKKMNKNVKKVLGSLSHYRFRQRLQNKCAEYRCQYLEVTEEYTSKTCSNCGNLKGDLEGERVYECENCKQIINRDVNGSINIFIKNRLEMIE